VYFGVSFPVLRDLCHINDYQSARSVTAGKLDKCLHFLSNFTVRKLTIGPIIRYVSLKITEKNIVVIIIVKPNIFTKTRTQDCFRVCDLNFCNLLTKTNNFVLCAVLLLYLVFELQKSTSPVFEPRTIFRGCGLCSCSLVETTSVLATLFYRAQFLWYRNPPHLVSNCIYYFACDLGRVLRS
jgi:hypothetical protein